VRIEEVRWANYRRMPDGHLAVRDHLVLVGPNDTGKSSVIRAVNLCIGASHGALSGAVSCRDFTDPTNPLEITITLTGIEADDEAAFPDEISVGPPCVLRVALEASVDPTDGEIVTTRRYFPDAGHSKAPSREQLKTIGFRFVPAARSLLRELGGTSGGAVRSLLSGLDLTADAVALQTAADAYRDALDASTVLEEFRGTVAGALTQALPVPVAPGDVRVVSDAELSEDPLANVTVTLKDGPHDVSLAEQSDGIRAVAVLTLLGMSHAAAKIVAVDEPETHLHPSAQRSLARSLVAGSGQRILATHYPAIVGEVDPFDLAAFRADRVARQLPAAAPFVTDEFTTRHWAHHLIEPLTARFVLIVEGPSDLILVRQVAKLLDVDLDRRGIAVLDLGGAKMFGSAYEIFGPAGFCVQMAGMVDEDARADWAAEIGVAPADLEAQGYVVCAPDLEGVYVDALGASAVTAMLLASPKISTNSIKQTCGVADLAHLTTEQLSAYCNKKKHKVAAALAIAAALTPIQARALTPIVDLLDLVP
jgi:putative ATP-dependent endonuclease of OLD family